MRFRAGEPRPLIWRGTSKSDYMAFPATVQREMGYALFLAQAGKRHATMAKTLKGFGGGTVVEVRETYGGDAYRAIYTVRFAEAVYVLHAFQKKLKTGVKTPKVDVNLGSVARLVGIEGGVVSGVFNLESSGVSASDWRPRHDEHYHEA
jgi:phage-related protein